MQIRSIKEFTCISGPRLLLVTDKPLDNDKVEIFDSAKGIMYLTEVFKSRFKSIDTHVTYVKDNLNNSLFDSTSQLLYKIFTYYNSKGSFDPKQFVVAFVGKKALENFKSESDSLIFDSAYSVNVREINSTIRFFISGINGGRDFYVPYTVLPDIDEDYSQIPTLLDSVNTLQQIKVTHSVTTNEFITYLNKILDMYASNRILGIKFASKVVMINNKASTIYWKLYDRCTNHEVIYMPHDIVCEKDTNEDRQALSLVLKEVINKVPLCGDNLKEFFDTYYKNFTPKFVTEEQLKPPVYNYIPDRPHWEITGDRNGNLSEWYEKWYNTVFQRLKNEDKLDNNTIIKEGYDIPHRYEWFYDIEVFKNDWLFVAKSMDGKSKVICWNDPISLRQWIRNKILIGFNNAGYDDSVIKHAFAYPYAEEGTATVKEFSDAMVMDDETVKKYPALKEEFKKDKIRLLPNFLSWDISFHMPFDIRRNSLKKLTMSVLNRRNYDSNVPFDTPRPLTEEERREVERYCEMDVDNTRDLFLPDPEDVKKKEENPKYKMREFAKDSYDIKWNLMVEYNMTAKTLINKSSSFAGKVLCGEDAKPNKANTFKDVNGKHEYYSIPDLAYKELAGTPILDFYIKNQTNPGYIKEKFEYHMGGNDEGHLYQFGFGGLHQALINFGSTNLCNFDVASLYPSLLIQYDLGSRGMANKDAYKEVYDTRIAAKHEGKTLLNLGLKLVLNGAIGAMLSNFNPLYDTWSNSSICVHGQLLLFILCKRLYEAGFNIVQTNTDGIMVERRDDIDFMPICKAWEAETRLVLEYDDIAVLQQNNVNNYYCCFTNGKVKSKGFYLSNEKYGKATSKILCNLVTNKPLLEGCEPRDFVIYKRHSIGEIYDAKTNQKLEGRSLAFVVGYPEDSRTQSYYSRSRNEREVVVKDENGKVVKDENGQNMMETIHSISKINGFTDHMLLVDDINTLQWNEINTKEYINFAKNLLDKKEVFGPYYNENFVKVDEVTYLQALNPLKDNTDEHPTKSGVVCQNFLFECDYLSKEEQEELIEPIKDYTYRVVWSGNRSYHIVIRLNKPVTSTSYKKIWYYLQHRLGLDGADEMVALPNRYTRVPDQINPKTGNMQELYCENKYEFDLDDILDYLPKLKDELKQPTQYKGKVDMKSLERHIKKQDWSEGNRFTACQKLSPILISQVTMEELIKMIPTRLEKNHLHVIQAKYYYWEKYKDLLIKKEGENTPLDDSEEI